MTRRFIFRSLDVEIPKLIASCSYISLRYTAILKTGALSKGIAYSIFYSSDLKVVVSCIDEFFTVLMSQ